MRKIDTRESVLHNGLKVISVHTDSDIFTIGSSIKTGSLYESKYENGISHLIEHMLFKGTKKRSAAALNEDIERLAGDIDVYTTYNYTSLNASVLKTNAEKCIEIIADMFINAAFPSKELKLEKNVIAEEIKMDKDNIEDITYEGLYKLAFLDNAYKLNITGTLKTVKAISRRNIIDYYKKNYIPKNTIICTVSSYSHEEIVQIIKKYFYIWNNEEQNRSSFNFNFRDLILPCTKTKKKSGITQCHILYGFDINNLSRKEEIILTIINRKLGGGSNSILFKELRDNKGYAYNVYSDMDFTEGIKLLFIYTAVSKDNLKDTIKAIDGIISKFGQDDNIFNELDLKTMKDIFNTEIVAALESPHDMIDYLLNGEINYNNYKEYEYFLSEIDNIKLEDIYILMKKIFLNTEPIKYILLSN